MPTETKPRAADAATATIESLTASHQDAMRNMETAGAAVLDGLTRVGREMTEFVSERIRQDMEAQQELLRCRTFGDFQQVQSRFMKAAVDQYAAEATKLMKLSGEMMAKGLERRDV
jgi:hypothetical protein